jgi:KDO2-lipid IV(A) lauroyltransferase
MTERPPPGVDADYDEDGAPLWTRFLARWPWPALYALASLLAFLAYYVVGYRRALIRHNLDLAFPELSTAERNRVRREYYLGFAQVLVEIAKMSRLAPEEIRDRVSVRNLEALRAPLAEGRPVLVVAAHQCNWEWMLHGLALNLGFPVDAAYKPLKNPWAERYMLQAASAAASFPPRRCSRTS